jgi:carbonic anhydrase
MTSMRKLLDGVRNFRERIFPKHARRFRDLARTQAPDTLIISCSDSRVVPDLIASADPGDLFTVRNVGNLIPCAAESGHSTGDVSEASAIEYAVLVLKVRNIIVCGHSECGAMKAVIAGNAGLETPNLKQWLCHADGAAARLASEAHTDLKPHDRLSQLNVLAQIEHLTTYKIVSDRIASGMLTLSGWWFDIGSGAVHAYDEARQRFEPVGKHPRL